MFKKTNFHSGNKYLMVKIPAFYLTEALIIFIVIGFIVAIILSAFLGKKNEIKYAQALQKAHFSLGKAFKLMSVNNEIDENTTTANYTQRVIPKYLKITKICDNAKDCDFPQKIKRPDGSVLTKFPTKMTEITTPFVVSNTKYEDWTYSEYSTTNNTTKNNNDAYFFITEDGFHVMFFYNPYCVNNEAEKPSFWTEETADSPIQRQLSFDIACFWGVYDMNGSKGPNQTGKDIGFTGSFYKGKNAQIASVLPHPSQDKPTSSLPGHNNHFERAYNYCNSLAGSNYRLPDINELSLMYLNREFVTDNTNKFFWSSSILPKFYYIRYLYFPSGYRTWGFPPRSINHVVCVRKYQEK